MLKDGLKEMIKMKICDSASLEFQSINELMKGWYIIIKDDINYKTITYMEQELNMVYDVVTDENGKIIEETDFVTIRKDLEDQIHRINKLLEV